MNSQQNQLIKLASGNRESNSLASLASRYETADPEDIMAWAFDRYGERLALATAFGAEGVALLDMAAKLTVSPQVFFLDTGFFFPETYELRRRLEDRYRVEIRAYRSTLSPASQDEKYGARLWESNPDLCCKLRKLEPLEEALQDQKAWMTAIRRDQTTARADAAVIEWDDRWQLVKVNPLARWTKKDVWQYIRKNQVPYNPLHDLGYPSIGCTHCTRAVRVGEDDRAGRWAGLEKTECGLHAAQQR